MRFNEQDIFYGFLLVCYNIKNDIYYKNTKLYATITFCVMGDKYC